MTLMLLLLLLVAVAGAVQSVPQTHGHWTLVSDVAPSDWLTLQVALRTARAP
jgi:carbonic anhydrase